MNDLCIVLLPEKDPEMDQTNQPPPNRRRFFGLLSAMGYVAPAVISLGVPAAGPDDARGLPSLRKAAWGEWACP